VLLPRSGTAEMYSGGVAALPLIVQGESVRPVRHAARPLPINMKSFSERAYPCKRRVWSRAANGFASCDWSNAGAEKDGERRT
jgi:hypothetical protein